MVVFQINSWKVKQQFLSIEYDCAKPHQTPLQTKDTWFKETYNLLYFTILLSPLKINNSVKAYFENVWSGNPCLYLHINVNI